MITIPPFPWWTIEDDGGFPPFWPYGMPATASDKLPWPWRPHP